MDNKYIIPVSNEVALFAAIMTSIFSLVGTIANLCTIIALWRSKLLKQATTKLIISLAMCDFFMCCLVFPPTAQRYTIENLGYPPIIHNMCKYFKYLEYGLFQTSILHLMAITINRYILICWEEVYDKIYCSRNVSIMISGIWLISFGFGLFPLFGIWGQIGKLNLFFEWILIFKIHSRNSFMISPSNGKTFSYFSLDPTFFRGFDFFEK